jgi:hypothetical protein
MQLNEKSKRKKKGGGRLLSATILLNLLTRFSRKLGTKYFFW